MFGHHEAAQAKVLDAEEVFSNWESEGEVKVEFVLEVYPPNGQPFRAKASHHFVWAYPKPKVGDMINVKYDPKSLSVELVLHGDNRYGAQGEKHREQVQRQAEKDRENALLSAPPGTPPAPNKAPYNANLDPELQELMQLEEQERQAMQASGQQRHAQGNAGLDPELQELLQMEEAERRARHGGGQQQHAQGGAVPANSQAVWALEEHQMLRRHLEQGGASGKAQILRKQQAGAPVQQFTPFFVEVTVQPDNAGYPFQCSFTTWVDTSRGALTEGYTLPVRYDPQNTSRIVFIF